MLRRYLVLFVLGSLPLVAAVDPYFEPDARGGFLGRWPHGTVRVDSDGITLEAMRLRWSEPSMIVRPEQKLAGISNYFWGRDPSKWRTAVPHYARIRLSGVSDIVVYSSARQLEFDFEIPAGRDPSSMGIDFPADVKLALADRAILIVAGARQYRLNAPFVYQLKGGKRTRVEGRFVLEGPYRVGFSIDSYDRTKTLVIDPVLEWLTYYGGNGEDQVLTEATDSTGNVYLGGGTTSTNLPFITGGVESSNPGTAAFVTKLNSSGTEILYSTYLGGTAGGYAMSLSSVRQLVVDASGNVYGVGNTYDGDFPITTGAWVSSYSGTFAVKLNASGSQLLYSTFLGVPDVGLATNALAVDGDGVAYIGGTVSGPQFIGTQGSYQPVSAGSTDGILLALNPSGTGSQFGTLLGGSGIDQILTLALDPYGNIIVGGYTGSSDFPVTNSSTSGGNFAGFLSAFDPLGSHLLWSTYVTHTSQVSALSIKGLNVLACGSGTPSLTFPATVTPTLPYSAESSGYIAEFNAQDGSPQLLSMVPGSCSGIALDTQGYVYLIANGFEAKSGGAVAPGLYSIAMLSPDLTQILFDSGVDPDAYVDATLTALSVDTAGRVSFAGYGSSLTLPTTSGVVQPAPDPAHRTSLGSGYNPDDGFAGRFDLGVFRQGNFLASLLSQSTYSFHAGSTAVLATIPIVVNGSLTLQASASVPWLTATVVPGGIQVAPNASAVPASNVAVEIFVSAAEIPGSQIALPATMTVLANPMFTVDTTPIAISLYSGLSLTPPFPTRSITYNFSGQSYDFSAVSSSPSWLYPNVTFVSPGQAQLQINVGQLSPGTYTGSVSVSLSGASYPAQIVPVTYTVLPGPTMTLSASSVTLAVQPGQSSTSSINISSSVPNFPVTLFVGTYPVWLTTKLSSQTTPSQLVMTANPPAGTALGLYYVSGLIGLQGQSSTAFSGTIAVTAASGISAVPTTISFTDYRGNPPVTTPSIQVVAPQPTTVTLAADQTWISFTSPTFVTPNFTYVAFNDGSLAEGSYNANIFVRDNTGKTVQTIPVSFSVYNAPVLTYSSAPVAFQYNLGDPVPAKQTLHVSSPTIKPGYFTIGPTTFPSWLSATPQSAGTPVDITLAADPTGLGPGVYQTMLSITPQYSIPTTTGGGSIPVTLTVSGAVHPLISAVISAASGLPAVSPGELVLIYGTGLGGATVSSAQLTFGSLPSSWSGTSVMFGEFSAPVLYTAGNVVCVSVPYGVAGRASVSVSVSYQGNQGPATPVNITPSAPGLFTADESGGGQASAFTVNPDGTYQISNASHPAAAGDTLIFYLTGAGVISPSSPDGSVNSTVTGSPGGPVTATIGNQPAQVLYCGTVPGLLNAVVQVNVQVPAGVSAGGQVPLAVFIAGNPTQPGVTLAIN